MINRQKILIVDDKPANLFSLEQILKETDAEIIQTENGNQALIASLHNDFAMAILDVQMPKMDGYELAELLRSEKKTNKLPIIFVSAVYSDDYHVFKGYESGAVDFLVKPFNAKILLSKVAIFLELDLQKNELNDSRTRIKNQLNQLKMSETRFETLVLTVPDIVYRIDPDGNFTFINDSIGKLGYKPQELMGLHFSCIILAVDIDSISRRVVLEGYKTSLIKHQKSIKLFDERRTGKRKTTGLEIRLIPKKGTSFLSGMLDSLGADNVLVEVNSTGLYSDQAQKKDKVFIGTVVVIRDITARKKLEYDLRKSNDELDQKVKERTQELYEVNKDLETLVIDLKKALGEVKQLTGLLPICSHCKKIRDDKGYWNQIEGYIQEHSDAEFSHGMCPECSDELYGKEDWYIEMQKEENQKE